MEGSDPSAALQPRAEVRQAAHLDFVVIVDSQGVRYTHADPSLIGERIPVAQDLDAQRSGRTVTGRNETGSHTAMRTFMPIRDSDGAVIGGVAVGVRVSNISAEAVKHLPTLLGVTAAAVAASTAGAVALSRRLLRQTHSLGPAEITRLYRHHDAVLHAAREGIVIVDSDRRLLLVNEEAQSLLGLSPQALGRRVDELALAPLIADLLATGRKARAGRSDGATERATI